MRVPSVTTRDAALPAAALTTAAAAAWVGLLAMGDMDMAGGGPAAFAGFQAAWLVMMAAMMLPSIVPFTTLVRRTAPDRPAEAAGLAAGAYLAVWSATGAAAYALSMLVMPSPAATAAALAIAGTYQLTPLKTWCLRRCRSPLGFLLQHARPGLRTAALRLGVRHAAHCVGCCWALMLLLVAGLGMGLGWAGLLAGTVFVEKALAGGERAARLLGLTLLAAAVAVLVEPGLAGRHMG